MRTDNELARLLKKAKRVMEGDSNDAEHDVLCELVEHLENRTWIEKGIIYLTPKRNKTGRI